MSPVAIRRWAWLHKWSSLVCTVFMLLLCITGLPLIYHHEIGHLLGNEAEPAKVAAGTPHASVDKIIAAGKALYPDKVMMFMSQEDDEPDIWNLTLGDHPNDDKNYVPLAIDARTTEVLKVHDFENSFIGVMFHLHVDLYAGLYGKLFLGFMGLLLVIAIISGMVLYAPFMRKLDFGTVRRERARRLKWLDIHNLLGIVTLVWALVVGATGIINTWADLLVKYWQYTEVNQMLEAYRKLPPLSVDKQGSMETAMRNALAREPGMKIAFVAFPGTLYASPHHYGVFLRGDEALTSRLYKPVLVDAGTSQVTDSLDLPWYLTALLVSQPLHFGDYGGPVMQFLWAMLDIATIVVLGSGLYLWLKRGVTVPKQEEEGVVDDDAAMPALARAGEAP